MALSLTPYSSRAFSRRRPSVLFGCSSGLKCDGYIINRSALLPSRCKISNNMTELHRYSVFVTYCVYANRDQSMFVLGRSLCDGVVFDS